MVKKLFIFNLLVCFVLSIGISSAGPPQPTSEKSKPPATPLPKPDLVITSIEFKDIKNEPYGNYGDCWFFKVYFTIKNQSNVSAPSCTLFIATNTWTLRGKAVDTDHFHYIPIPSLSPFETRTITIWDASMWCPVYNPSTPSFEAIIDYYNKVSESNEDNNSMKKQFSPPQFKPPIQKK